MGRLIDSLLRRATRTGLRRGLGGEHWAWLVVAGAAYMLQRARRPDTRTEQIDIRPGERYLVSLQPRFARRRNRGGNARRTTSDTSSGAEEADGPHPESE